MSDIGIADGIGAFLAGLAFLGLGALLLLALGVFVVVLLAQKRSPLKSGGVLGLTISVAMIGISAAGSFAAAEYAATVADDYLLVWAPGLLLVALVSGVLTGLFVQNTKGPAE
jgi:hypothetical protein